MGSGILLAGFQAVSTDTDRETLSDKPLTPGRARRSITLAVVAGLLATCFVATGTARAALEQVAEFLSLRGKPEPASANVLSEHETETLDSMAPQSQAELLLERSINHYAGANEQIESRVARWRGKIALNRRLNDLFVTSINSDDLRVRAAGIEVDLAARNLEKVTATIDRLEADARSGEQGPRANALWDLGLLGNRGVDPARIVTILLDSVRDPNDNIRYWAVEALAYLGTDATIAPLLEIFHDDPSPQIRERAACGLAQSGMLSAGQRRTAVPRLIEFAEELSLPGDTRTWVFQALRDITGQNLPHDAAAWRKWYESER